MGNIVFAKTRHFYQSYTDFWRLAELSDFPTCYVDEIDFQSDNLYITSPMNGDYRAHVANHKEGRKCVLAHWLLERPDKSLHEFRSTNQELVDTGLVDLNIVSCPQMAQDTGFHYIVMGSHPDLGIPNFWHDKQYDVIGLMAYMPRRAFLFETPECVKTVWEGLRLAPNCWGEERHKALRNSYHAINVHKDTFPYCEPLRMALFASYGLVVVTEHLPFDHPYGGGVSQTDLMHLAERCHRRKGLLELTISRAQYFRKAFCSTGHTFRDRLEARI